MPASVPIRIGGGVIAVSGPTRFIEGGLRSRWLLPSVHMDYVAVVSSEAKRISDLARRGPLDARVPHMKRWTLGDVIAHLGGVHRWAASIVSSGWEGKGHRGGAETGDALVAWFEEGADLLVSTLQAADLTAKCGNFSPGSPNTAHFWFRRQAHETTMHRWDVESAIDAQSPIDATFATDGIDELFHTFTRARGKQALEDPIRIVTTDTEMGWTLAPTSTPGRVDLTTDDNQVVANLSGPAEALLLALWKRISLDGVEISGDAEVVRRFVAGPVSP